MSKERWEALSKVVEPSNVGPAACARADDHLVQQFGDHALARASRADNAACERRHADAIASCHARRNLGAAYDKA